MKFNTFFVLFALIGGIVLGPRLVFGIVVISLKTQCENAESRTRSNHNLQVGKIEPTIPSGGGTALDQRCQNNKNDFSALCVKWAAEKASKAMDSDGKCRGKITPALLMCIFRKEVYWKPTPFKSGDQTVRIDSVDTTPKRYCRYNSSCGLAQMTKNGASTVLEGFARYNLGGQYDAFWSMVGRRQNIPNKCEITKKSAKDRDMSAIMAATHLCVELKRRSGRGWKSDSRVLARDYNGSRGRNHYANWVQSCIDNGKDDVAVWGRRQKASIAAMTRALGGESTVPMGSDAKNTPGSKSQESGSSQ